MRSNELMSLGPQVDSLELRDPLEQPAGGSLAAVSFSEDGLVYRAKVIVVESSSNVAVTATLLLGGVCKRRCSRGAVH